MGSVTNMGSMFSTATVFNQNIAGWNVGSVTNMASMFISARAFNQNISGWNVGLVTNMSYMFYAASAFNQNLCAWKNVILSLTSANKVDIFAVSGCTYTATPTSLSGTFCTMNTCT